MYLGHVFHVNSQTIKQKDGVEDVQVSSFCWLTSELNTCACVFQLYLVRTYQYQNFCCRSFACRFVQHIPPYRLMIKCTEQCICSLEILISLDKTIVSDFSTEKACMQAEQSRLAKPHFRAGRYRFNISARTGAGAYTESDNALRGREIWPREIKTQGFQ